MSSPTSSASATVRPPDHCGLDGQPITNVPPHSPHPPKRRLLSSAPAPRPETRRQRPRRHVPSALKPASKSQCGNLEAVEAIVDAVDDRAVRENRRKAPPAGLDQICLVSRV